MFNDYDCDRSYFLERLVASLLIAVLIFGGFVFYLYAVHCMSVKNVNDYYSERTATVESEGRLLDVDTTVELQTSDSME